ncbi:FXYD domain-containing ion transport regulator 5 isoform X1 [Sapajus apella]|uniref:FXYD domain-containing ion transport regulator 5 isoform X1 n=1 Tax=Sapajus apella TaxID=9515 RepID=A0A6J3FH85_SAPAP|nr:FXYD domain-containing ion transport regulator 5 isoform X1 [Sapajus apella]XP_032104951.1 FXYD domain-containing ion transport regulator 5 isoform X1 [Sapajus apella]
MSPSGRLCLLTIVGLILPTRGQTPKEPTSISSADPNIVDFQVLTPAPDAIYPEVQPTPPIPTRPADETPQPQTQTPQPTGMDEPLVTDPEIPRSTKAAHPTKGTTTLSERPSPRTDVQTHPQTVKPSGSHEDDPFFYGKLSMGRCWGRKGEGPSDCTPPFFSLQMNTPSGNGDCWSQLCCSSQASSSSPVASAGSCPSYAGIIAGESIRSRGRQPAGHPETEPPVGSPCPASCIPSKSPVGEGRHRRWSWSRGCWFRVSYLP